MLIIFLCFDISSFSCIFILLFVIEVLIVDVYRGGKGGRDVVVFGVYIDLIVFLFMGFYLDLLFKLNI